MAGLFGSGKNIAPATPVKVQVSPTPQQAALRPPQQDTGGNAKALASALGSLNGSLRRYAEVDLAIKENPESLANREWIARAQQMSKEELEAALHNGETDGRRVREDAAHLLLGEKAVSDTRAEIAEYFNTGFDYQSGDAQAEIDEIITRHAQALPTDISRAAFTRGMGTFRQGWLDKVTEIKVSDAKVKVNSAIVDSFRNTIDDAQANGRTAAETAALVLERSASNRTFLGLSGQEQNETILAIAQEAANRGDVDLVDALVNGERKGAGGETIPALSRIAGISDKTTRLMDVARNRQTEVLERENFAIYDGLNRKVADGTFTQADAEPLIAKGALSAKGAATAVRQSDANRAQAQARAAREQQELGYKQANERQTAAVVAAATHELETYAGVTNIRDVEVVSKSGEGTTTVSKKQIIDTAIARKEQALQDKRAMLIQEGTSEADADRIVNRDRVSFYAANALDNSAWQMQFNGIAAMVAPDALAKGGAPSQQAQDVAELYLQVRAANPAYAEGIVSNPQAREFLDAYEIERNVTRLPPDRAAVAASLWQAKPEHEKNRYRMKDEDRDKMSGQVLNDALGGGWFTSVDTGGANYALVRSKVEQLSRMNLPEAVIKQRTEEWLKTSTTSVNGMLMVTNGRTPSDFKPLAEARLATLFEEVKEAEVLDDEDASDLYLVPTPSGGSWTVWSKSRRVPLAYTITEADLERGRQAARDKRAAEGAAASGDAAAIRRQEADTQQRMRDADADISAGFGFWQ
ncbi:hypothetical protein EYF88_11325 [Paracoccus sediminis]|uniref:Uncharacterized protein n=1 Tax=Paracoccus sediminis TaxID=1214787 RepID=A0A238XE78_9RHOB|nr:hypothetical protein [Paracoccus sediminis]TBN49650.1 hypothetical protein EYF88_11325 [Paracoccus sediminis]SNR56783.1 hypothetical protein SAMN06265378_10987 [Paracoccus sediminis]